MRWIAELAATQDWLAVPVITRAVGDPSVAVVVALGWDWVAVAGPVEIAGPDDALPEMPADRVRHQPGTR